MTTVADQFLDGFLVCFAELDDPRVEGRCDHLLLDILVISRLAVMCKGEDFTDIEELGRGREQWLKEFLELPNGIPSHDTVRRVLGALDRQQFATCLFRWTQALCEATDGKLIAIDGKTLRGSASKKRSLPLLHLVTAWSSENSLTLGQVACSDKSNEIVAIPELLKRLSLKGCTVTIDAMGCQKAIAQQIREQKGHYVLSLKGNQKSLFADMRALFADGIETDFAGMTHRTVTSDEKCHGRLEDRAVHVIAIPKEHRQRENWKDLNTLVVVTSRREIDGEEKWESRSLISSHPPNAKPLARAIRQHWTIENSQHWILDVAFDEDRQQQRDRTAAVNLAAIRLLVLSLLRQEQSKKRSIKTKRFRCGIDSTDLLQVLSNARFDA